MKAILKVAVLSALVLGNGVVKADSNDYSEFLKRQDRAPIVGVAVAIASFAVYKTGLLKAAYKAAYRNKAALSASSFLGYFVGNMYLRRDLDRYGLIGSSIVAMLVGLGLVAAECIHNYVAPEIDDDSDLAATDAV